jgi:hypothetical protein
MKMFALALSVWGLGAACTAALTIELSRSPTPRGPAIDVTSIRVAAPRTVRHAGQEDSVLTVPPITIVGRRAARPLGVTERQKAD